MFIKYKAKIICVVLALLIIGALFTSCGDTANKDYLGNDEGGENLSSRLSELDDNSSVSDNRKLIREVELHMQTKDLGTLIHNLQKKTKELNGYVDSENISERHAELVLKIPSEKLDSFVEYTKGAGNITRSNLKTIDVTLEQIDLESHIASLEAQLQSLRSLLENKGTHLSEIMQIMQRINDVEAEIDTYCSALNVLKNRVSYSKITIEANQVSVVTQVSAKGMWGEIANKFLNNLNNVLNFLKNAFVWIVSNTPYFALIAIIVFIFVVIIKLYKKREIKKKNKKLEVYKQLTKKAESDTDK